MERRHNRWIYRHHELTRVIEVAEVERVPIALTLHFTIRSMQPTSLLLTTAIAAFSLVAAQSNDTLVPLVFKPLPLSSIKPAGWLKDQLQLMSDGLAGHEHDFYAYVAHSSWLGGEEEYSSLNEGFPYWLNGLVPLAYSLDDARLKDQVHSSVQIVLNRQGDDGWIGPETGTARNFWARYPLCLGLIQLAEANSTWTEPIVDSLHRFTQLMHDMLAQNYTGYLYHEGDKLSADDDSWGRVGRHPRSFVPLRSAKRLTLLVRYVPRI